jgi:hypothetical protein
LVSVSDCGGLTYDHPAIVVGFAACMNSANEKTMLPDTIPIGTDTIFIGADTMPLAKKQNPWAQTRFH